MSNQKNKRKKKQQTPKVFVATLSPGRVHTQYSVDLASLCLEDRGRTIKQIWSVRSARSHEGRNKAIQRFLESDCDWLLWIDSDMGFSYHGTYLPLLDEMRKTPEAKILNALAFIWFGNAVAPNIYRWGDRAGSGVETFELDWEYEYASRFWCDATGVAFTLIHRDVFEALPWDRWHEDWFQHPANGLKMGHDLAFFWQAGQHGYKVRYVTDARTQHIKDIAVDEKMFAGYLKQLEVQRARAGNGE